MRPSAHRHACSPSPAHPSCHPPTPALSWPTQHSTQTPTHPPCASPCPTPAELLVNLPLSFFLPPRSDAAGRFPLALDLEPLRAAEADGACSLALRTPCLWRGAEYRAVGPVAEVQVTSVLSANETMIARESLGIFEPPPPPPSPPSPPPPAASPPPPPPPSPEQQPTVAPVPTAAPGPALTLEEQAALAAGRAVAAGDGTFSGERA